MNVELKCYYMGFPVVGGICYEKTLIPLSNLHIYTLHNENAVLLTLSILCVPNKQETWRQEFCLRLKNFIQLLVIK